MKFSLNLGERWDFSDLKRFKYIEFKEKKFKEVSHPKKSQCFDFLKYKLYIGDIKNTNSEGFF